MGMTEYEVADIAASVLANFLTSLTVFLSIVSAYVISAFVAGQRLTKIQLSIVNLCRVSCRVTLSAFLRFGASARSGTRLDWGSGFYLAAIGTTHSYRLWLLDFHVECQGRGCRVSSSSRSVSRN